MLRLAKSRGIAKMRSPGKRFAAVAAGWVRNAEAHSARGNSPLSWAAWRFGKACRVWRSLLGACVARVGLGLRRRLGKNACTERFLQGKKLSGLSFIFVLSSLIGQTARRFQFVDVAVAAARGGLAPDHGGAAVLEIMPWKPQSGEKANWDWVP